MGKNGWSPGELVLLTCAQPCQGPNASGPSRWQSLPPYGWGSELATPSSGSVRMLMPVYNDWLICAETSNCSFPFQGVSSPRLSSSEPPYQDELTSPRTVPNKYFQVVAGCCRDHSITAITVYAAHLNTAIL